MSTFTFHDESIKDIRRTVNSLREKYTKITKKDPNNVRLYVIVKRGPITMEKGEWAKSGYDSLTLDLNKVATMFSRKNLNWGILGYGDPKDGLKGLMKFAKTKLNPAQLKGDRQDLKFTINEAKLLKSGKDGKKVVAKIVITVPDKSLGGKDVENKVLKENGYIGINEWKNLAKGLLGSSELDVVLTELLENKASLEDVIEFEKLEIKEDSEIVKKKETLMKALESMGFSKGNYNSVVNKLDFSKNEEQIVKQALKLVKK